MKIYLSPSNQTENRYAVGNTNEAAQCRAIAAAAEKAFLRCGFTVKCSNPDSMYDAVAESNAFGADYHLCIHTNAYNGSVSGTRLFSYDAVGTGCKACQAVMEALAPITPGTSDSITPNPALYEVRAAKAYTVYIEIGFHDNKTEAAWIIAHTTEIAEAICRGMCNHCGIAYIQPQQPLYRVQVGAFRNRDNAVRMLIGLQKAGFSDAFIAVSDE